MAHKFLASILISCCLFGNVNWTNYGWELFDYVSEARTSSLGNATVAYNFDYPSSALSNPCFPKSSSRKISLTHQSRFAGLINSELVSFQLKKEERLINLAQKRFKEARRYQQGKTKSFIAGRNLR